MLPSISPLKRFDVRCKNFVLREVSLRMRIYVLTKFRKNAWRAWEHNSCSTNKTEAKRPNFPKWESSFNFYLVWPFLTMPASEWILIVRKYWQMTPVAYKQHENHNFLRDFDLNQVCEEICVEETLACITDCDSTDSECISSCLRAEATCVGGEYYLK